MVDILQKIVDQRLKRIESERAGQGLTLPETRDNPPLPFGSGQFVICEIKRKSPSAGNINAGLDPIKQAEHYFQSGVRAVSVLTEQDHFGGSLNDLIQVKKNFPGLSVLRKDFLLSVEDVEITNLVGADAFLLIAAVLEKETLEAMYHRGKELGMTPLVEVHSPEEIDKVSFLKPDLMGVNCRNLTDFTMDVLLPLKLRQYINWPCRLVYESGIKTAIQGQFATGTGFNGLLVGEGAVKDKSLAGDLNRICENPSPSVKQLGIWKRLYDSYAQDKPFVKICGITRREDAEKAVQLGADIIGFILAPSPRKTSSNFIRSLKDLKVIKTGVVVLEKDEDLPREIQELLDEGYLDFIQFHGKENSSLLSRYPSYKALRVQSAELPENLYSPTFLLDAFVPGQAGGTGKQIPEELINELKQKVKPLWLAGGINPDNVRDILDKYHPELIDIASGVELAPGIKDHQLLEKLFKEIRQ